MTRQIDVFVQPDGAVSVTEQGHQLGEHTLESFDDDGRNMWKASGQKVPDDIAAELERAARKEPDEAAVLATGRYLFDVLLGPHWATIVPKNNAQPEDIDLRLGWAPSSLDHLPWELMHDGAGFLLGPPPPSGSRGRIALTRVVGKTLPKALPLEIQLPLKVLFIVLSTVDDPDIRPGAEFFCVLERLRAGGHHHVDLRVLVDATRQELADAVKAFGPDVAHIVAHGDVELERAYLKVRPTRDQDDEPLYADGLAALLTNDAGALVPIVVLSACHTGANPARAQLSSPLAAALVAKGVKVAVGMGGRVADLACRMFSRGLYDALATGKSVPQAVNQGRLAALRFGVDVKTSIDWARPALFLSGSASGTIQAHPAPKSRAIQVKRALRRYTKPSPFCARMSELTKAADFLDSEEKEPRVLAVVTSRVPEGGAQLGKGRLLNEIGLMALDRGWAPVMLLFETGNSPRPHTLATLAEYVDNQIGKCWQAFDPDALPKLLAGEVGRHLEQGDGFECPQDASRLKQTLHQKDRLGAYREALLYDLAQLGEATQRRPLLILDDVDHYGELAKELLGKFLGGNDDKGVLNASGLGRYGPKGDRKTVPVVLSGLVLRAATERGEAAKAYRLFVESGGPQLIELNEFRSDSERALAYRHALLGWEPAPLAPAAEGGKFNENEKLVFDAFKEIVGSVPSNLAGSDIQAVVRWLKYRKQLVEASPETILTHLAAGGGGGANG